MNLSRFLHLRSQGARFDLPIANGGGDPPQQTSTTNTTQMYSPEEAARRAALMAEAERVYASAKGTVGASAPTGPSAQTQQAQQMMLRYAKANPTAGMAQQLTDATQFGMSDVLNPTSNPGFQASLDTATRRVGEAYTDPGGVFSSIRSGFTGNNSGGSGSREGVAMGIAGREYLNTIGDVTGQMTSDAYNKGLDVFSRTMALAPQNMAAVQNSGMLPANITGAIGQQNEAYDEQSRQWNLNSPWAALGPYASMVHGMANPSTQSTSTQPGGRANPMAPVGGALMGASMGTMMGFNPIIGAGAGLALSLFN